MPLPSQVVASAPGKLILMGEHAVVYGRPAMAVAIGLRTRVRMALRRDARIRLLLPDLGIEELEDWRSVAVSGDGARRAWTAYAVGGATGQLERIRSADRALVVRTALAEAARALGASPPVAGPPLAGPPFAGEPRGLDASTNVDLPPGVDVEVSSELPIGAGFGSSASVAVATAGALVALATGREERELVDRVALEVERRQHGNPSGVDHRTVLNGGVLWAERSDEGELRVETLSLRPRALSPLVVLHTGTPAESTGRMVESVRERFEGRSARLEALLDDMESKVLQLRERLTGKVDTKGVVELFAGYERHLEALGVVPEAVRKLVRAIESLGAAAKVSGAGGLAGPEAGSLLAYDPKGVLAAAGCVAGLRRFDAPLGVPGLEIEGLG